MHNQRPHIALIGFMGSGKTSLGRALSKQLEFHFVDLDTRIEQAAGESISAIFEGHGEAAFRLLERSVLATILETPSPTVIATGGGTFCDSITKERLKNRARTLYLSTDVPSILSRVGSGLERERRPLLKGPEALKSVSSLLERRLPAYKEAEFTVETSSLSLDQVLRDVLGKLIDTTTDQSKEAYDAPLSLQITSSKGPYEVEFRESAGSWIAQGIARLTQTSRVAVITDSTVEPLHAPALLKDLLAQGIEATLLVFPAGERSKTLDTASDLYARLLELELTREDTLVALGGGVVGDITGFVASTFLRGVNYIQVPTTTLASVDSSVGGKTAVNTPHGKNLIGTFHPPKGVFIAISHLATQDRHQHAAGLVEALKMSATMDAPLFNSIIKTAPDLLDYRPAPLLEVLYRSIALKGAIVSKDEEERGVRAVLNYGHTVGHAIEKGEHFKLLHGKAVGLGMLAEAEFALDKSTDKQTLELLIEGLRALEMPTAWSEYSIDLNALKRDKKRLDGGKQIKIPIVTSLGTFKLQSISISKLEDYLRRRTTS